MFFTKKKEKKYTEKIAELEHKVAELTDIVKTQELIKLRADNARLLEKEQLISKIHFKLKDVAYLEEEGFVLAKYEPFQLKVLIDEEGNPRKNDVFYAINKLRLISFDDMKKITAVLNSIKKGR